MRRLAPRHRLGGLYDEIVKTIEAKAHPRILRVGSRYHKNPDYISYGLYTAEEGEVIRGFKRRLGALSSDERLVLAERLYRAGVAELRSVGACLLNSCRDSLTPAHFPYLDRVAGHLKSWSATDEFSINILGSMLLRYPAATLELLRAWNRSPNRWKRRASVVAFGRKIGASGRFTDDALRLCDALIWDRDDLVQKAVGWALKDTMRGNRRRVYAYLRHLRTIGAPATITLYAMRDLKGRDRSRLLELRPGRRSSRGLHRT